MCNVWASISQTTPQDDKGFSENEPGGLSGENLSPVSGLGDAKEVDMGNLAQVDYLVVNELTGKEFVLDRQVTLLSKDGFRLTCSTHKLLEILKKGMADCMSKYSVSLPLQPQ